MKFYAYLTVLSLGFGEHFPKFALFLIREAVTAIRLAIVDYVQGDGNLGLERLINVSYFAGGVIELIIPHGIAAGVAFHLRALRKIVGWFDRVPVRVHMRHRIVVHI